MPDYVIDNLVHPAPDFTDGDVARIARIVEAAGFGDYFQASGLIARGYSKIVLDKDVKGGMDDVVAAVQAIILANSAKGGPAVGIASADYAQAAGLLLRGISKVLLAKDFAGLAADVYAAAQALGVVAK